MRAEERLLEAAREVAFLYRAYRSYGGRRAAALRALVRRVPEARRDAGERAFDFFCRVHDAAVKAVDEAPRPPRPTKKRYSAFEDIDFAACMERLDAIEPGWALSQKRDMLTMVIGYYYLR